MNHKYSWIYRKEPFIATIKQLFTQLNTLLPKTTNTSELPTFHPFLKEKNAFVRKKYTYFQVFYGWIDSLVLCVRWKYFCLAGEILFLFVSLPLSSNYWYSVLRCCYNLIGRNLRWLEPSLQLSLFVLTLYKQNQTIEFFVWSILTVAVSLAYLLLLCTE